MNTAFPWKWENFKHTDVWNSHIDLKAELDSSLDACDGIHPTSFIRCRHLDLCYTWDSPCRETGAAGSNQVLVCLGEVHCAAAVPIALPGQDGEPRKVPSSSLMFTFDQRALLLPQGGIQRSKERKLIISVGKVQQYQHQKTLLFKKIEPWTFHTVHSALT